MSEHHSSHASKRRYEFDWLRVAAILVIFLYHSTRFFNVNDWGIKNINTYAWLDLWTTFADTWIMPLFFVISGISLFYTIGKRGGFSGFYVDRFMRLMVPVTIASVTHCAMQVYLERVMHGRFSGTFFSYLPQYFNGLYQGIDAYTGNFAFQGLHLWYLLFLFIDSLICYRLFKWLRAGGSGFLNSLTNLFAVPGLIYIWFSIPLVLMYAFIPQAILRVGAGAWGFFYYIWFLIAGFIIISSEKLQKTIRNQRLLSLVLGIILLFIYLFRKFGPLFITLPQGADHWVYTVIYFLSTWCWVFAFTGYAIRFLAFDRPLLQKANEGVLPFYILHQSVLVLFGFYIMTMNIPDILKWIIVFILSFIFIIIVYLILISKFQILRFLFGMKITGRLSGVVRSKTAIAIMHVLYIGLIAFAVSGKSLDRSPMPLTFNPENDIILSSGSISSIYSEDIKIISDNEASGGKAIEFISGANGKGQADPDVYAEFKFSAPAGHYYIWVRGKSNKDALSDSFWLQADGYINTRYGVLRLGNWHDINPAGKYSWAGDGNTPVSVELKHSGEHLIRIQPRQVPCRVDEIWLSRTQRQIPGSFKAVK